MFEGVTQLRLSGFRPARKSTVKSVYSRGNGMGIRLAAALIAASVVGAMSGGAAEAQSSQRYMRSASPNSSYMAGPRTRVFVTRRSWLDAGTEILRASAASSITLSRRATTSPDQNSLRGGWRRQPLPDPFDLPGLTANRGSDPLSSLERKTPGASAGRFAFWRIRDPGFAFAPRDRRHHFTIVCSSSRSPRPSARSRRSWRLPT